MIDKEILIKLAKLNGLRPWQQEKHYIQAMLLNILTEFDIIFKGGTYLWFFHNLPRFSEDLDFTLMSGVIDINEIKMGLELWGIENNIRIIKDNKISFSFRISIKGPLYTSDKDLCHVYVDISKRETILEKPISCKLEFPAYNLPIKFIRGLSLEELAAEKIRAILTRKKARDVYDLFYLIEQKHIPFNEELVKTKLAYYSMDFSKQVFLEAVKNHKDNYKAELKALVFGELPIFDEIVEKIKKWVET